MGHAHSHEHSDEAQTYYLDQLCTIALCGGLGAVGVLMWYPSIQTETGWRNLLSFILADQFHLPVLAGSIALLALVAIRAVVLWRSVGHAGDHHHDHAD